MKFYRIGVAIDQKSRRHLYTRRTAESNAAEMVRFGNHRASYGLEAALPLFRGIHFNWIDSPELPVGDIMSSSIFSPAAADIFRQMKAEFDLFELISIEGTPAFYIAPKRVTDINPALDVFRSEIYRGGCVVSQRFKDAWESAGLLGAEFIPIPATK